MAKIKELRGKWVKTDEITGKITSHLIFGEFIVKARKFMGVNKCTGFYLTGRKVVFVEKKTEFVLYWMCQHREMF